MEDLHKKEEIDPASVLNKDFGSIVERRRWLILLSFSLFSASSAMLWITFSPIGDHAQVYYDIDAKDVLEFSDSYMYIYFALSFLGSWLAYKWFSISLIGAMIINVVGAWLRYFAGQSFALALGGQYLAALAQNVVLFVPVLIADRWFPAHERNWAVSIATFSNLVGWGFGFLFPTILVQDGAEKIPDLLRIEAIISSIPLLIGIFFIKERPKVPPSYSALLKQNDHHSYWEELKSILKNIKFVLVTICFGNILGQSYTLSSTIAMLLPDSYTLLEKGYVGVAFIGSGIFCGMIGTTFLTKSKSDNYDAIVKLFMIISTIGLVGLAFTINDGNMTSIYLLNGLLGVGLLGFQPFGCQVLVEMTFPVQESISVNMMMVMGQAFGLIGNSLSTADWVGRNGLWALVAVMVPCILYVVFIHKTEAKRKKAEAKHKVMDEQMVKSMIESDPECHEDYSPLTE